MLAQKKPKVVLDDFTRFGEAMPDGRLTAPSDGKNIVCGTQSVFLRN